MKQFVMEKLKRKKIRYFVWGIGALIPPAAFFYLLEFYTHNPFGEVRPWAQFFNVLLFELTAGVLFCVLGDLRRAYRILAVAAMAFGLANAYVVRFRTNPIVPWDILSWRTAASVAANYDFTPDARMVGVTAVFIVIVAALHVVRGKWGTFICPRRWCLGLIPLAALLGVCHLLQQEDFQNRYRLYNKLFTPVFMTEVDGIPVTFVMNLAYMSLDKPEGYDREAVQALLGTYETAGENEQENAADTEELPNLIVVMNEAFSDLHVLGDFAVNQDYMPFLHSLQAGAENTVTGMLQVSVCGGNTANTEFEFLTGNTMAFLPPGSVPYQQYLTGECETLASHLRDLGYQTVATHPYYATGWERSEVYPWMGFDACLFIDAYANASLVRKYVSDDACAEKIITLYEQKEKGKPLFVFNVTMQNHGGYQDAYANFTPEVSAEGIENFSVSQYLSLVKLSDASLEKLVSYFSGVEEKTVVVFFGDHQPNDVVAAPILAQNGMAWNRLSEEEQKLRYQVPYVIWANYDIAEEQGADLSANFLAAEVLRYAGVPTSAYQKFLLELREEYPIISSVRTMTADGSEISVFDAAGKMDAYRRLQYYWLFDGKEER